MDSLIPLLFALLLFTAITAALLAVRGRQLARQLETAEAQRNDAETRAREERATRLGMQARLQGVEDADAERERVMTEVHTSQRQLLQLADLRQKADAELAEVTARLDTLRAELARLDERAVLPIRPAAPADRPEARG